MKNLELAESLMQRSSSRAFEQKFPEQYKSFISAVDEFTTKLEGLKTPLPEASNDGFYDILKSYVDEAEALRKITTRTSKGWVAKEGVKPEVFTKANDAFQKAVQTLHDVLSSEAGHKVGDTDVKAPEALTKAYGELTKATDQASKIMGGLGGNVRVNGWSAALKDNLHVFDEATRKGRGFVMGARLGGVAAGLTLTADAVFRSKSDGEARGTFTRVLEGATGLALAGGSALAGAAR